MTGKTQKTKTTTNKAEEHIFTLRDHNGKTFAIIKGDTAKKLVMLSEELKINPKEVIISAILEEYEKKHGKQKA